MVSNKESMQWVEIEKGVFQDMVIGRKGERTALLILFLVFVTIVIRTKNIVKLSRL